MLNNNFQKILIKFGFWLGTGILICIVGISGVFADTYNATQFKVEGYDNYGPSLTKVTTDFTNNSWRWTIPTMTANTSGTAFIFNSPIPLIANHTYILTSQITNSSGACIGLSTYNRIGLGTSISNSKSSYENNTNVNELYSNKSTCDTIQFAFTPTINGTWLTVPFNTSSNANNITFTIYNIVIDDLGSKSLTQNEINNSLTNQTNTLNNSITNSTNSIVNNSNSNKNEIIENQNKNSEELQNTLDESLSNVCPNLFDPSTTSACQFNNGDDGLGGCSATINDTNIDGGYVQFSTTSSWSGVHSDYVKVKQYGSYTLSFYNNNYESTGSVCLKINIYNSSKTFLSQDAYCSSSNFISKNITMPYNASYVRISLESQLATNYITLAKINFSDTNTFCPYGSKTSKLDEQINNANQNTQDIINNQNQNTQQQIESQKVCNLIDKANIIKDNYYLDTLNGTEIYNENLGITDYIDISNSKLTQLIQNVSNVGLCFYDLNKNYISCIRERDIPANSIIDIPTNSVYFRATINKRNNRPTFEICKNGNQALNDSITGLNDNLNDDDTSGATSEASDFFSSFNTNTFGLTSIITAPLNLIQSLTSSTCSKLHLPLPYLDNKYLDLPCMTSIYQTHFGTFFTMYQTITYGIIAYWVCVRIFNQVKDFKNPEHDEIEVVDL